MAKNASMSAKVNITFQVLFPLDTKRETKRCWLLLHAPTSTTRLATFECAMGWHISDVADWRKGKVVPIFRSSRPNKGSEFHEILKSNKLSFVLRHVKRWSKSCRAGITSVRGEGSIRWSCTTVQLVYQYSREKKDTRWTAREQHERHGGCKLAILTELLEIKNELLAGSLTLLEHWLVSFWIAGTRVSESINQGNNDQIS